MTIPRLLIDLMNIRHLIVDTLDGFDWASSLINYRFVTRRLPVRIVTAEFVPNFLNTIADCVSNEGLSGKLQPDSVLHNAW